MCDKKGYFITFEGADGAGKSTQIELLMKYFTKNNIKAISTREPGGTVTGEQVRAILLDPKNQMTHRTETLLYLAARSEHVDKIILPALKDDKIVVSDRFSHSTFVYQGIARGLCIDVLQQINLFATDGLQPDLTFVLDAPVDFLAKRMTERPLDRIEKEGLVFQKVVQQGFLQLAKKNPEKIVVVDATQTIEQVQAFIIKLVQEKLLNKFKGGHNSESPSKC